MKINDALKGIEIYTSNEEKRLLKELSRARFFNSFSEKDQYTIECMVKKSLVIKTLGNNPRVIANEL